MNIVYHDLLIMLFYFHTLPIFSMYLQTKNDTSEEMSFLKNLCTKF